MDSDECKALLRCLICLSTRARSFPVTIDALLSHKGLRYKAFVHECS